VLCVRVCRRLHIHWLPIMVCCLLMHAVGTSGQDAAERNALQYEDICSQCRRPVGEGGGPVAAHVIAYPVVPCSMLGSVGLAAGGPGAAALAAAFCCSFMGGPIGLKTTCRTCNSTGSGACSGMWCSYITTCLQPFYPAPVGPCIGCTPSLRTEPEASSR